MRRYLFLLLGISAAFPTPAQEVLLLGGATHHSNPSEYTHGWALEYAQGLGENVYATITGLNEGHLEQHHRDGVAAQLWGRANVLDRRLSLAAGVGPYRYFDTTRPASDAPYANEAGWGLVYSAGFTWYTDRRWLFHVRANRIQTHNSFDTTTLLAGAGYQLDSPPVRGPRSSAPSIAGKTTNNEATLFLGRTILNSLESEDSAAVAAEYRRGVGRHLDWTLGWLHEGGNHIIRRNGVTTQLWLVRPVVGERIALGIGAGGYLAVAKQNRISDASEHEQRVSGIVTLTGSYRFGPRWLARLSWNRVVTRYSRDTDVILLGVGSRF